MTAWGCEFGDFTLEDGKGEECPNHGTPLVRIDGGTPAPDTALVTGPGNGSAASSADSPVGEPTGESAEEPRCTYCGTPAPSTVNTRCLVCHKPLAPSALELQFADDASLVLERGENALLGRHRDSPLKDYLRGFRTVGRRHATIGVTQDGKAWLRDEDATNGTFVNGCELTPRLPQALRDGDEIGLGGRVRGTVTVRDGRRPGG